MSLFLLCTAIAFAGDNKSPEVKNLTPSTPYAQRPLRPTTHPMDLALTEGPIENFDPNLACNPKTIASTIKPAKAKGDGKENLHIDNRTTGWVDVWISGEKIGRLGPLTTGRINNVAAGDYHVTFEVEDTQFQYSEVTPTSPSSEALAPGNARANVANKAGYKKPGFDTKSALPSGKLKSYELPTSEEAVSPGTTPEPNTTDSPEATE